MFSELGRIAVHIAFPISVYFVVTSPGFTSTERRLVADVERADLQDQIKNFREVATSVSDKKIGT